MKNTIHAAFLVSLLPGAAPVMSEVIGITAFGHLAPRARLVPCFGARPFTGSLPNADFITLYVSWPYFPNNKTS